jgi:O-antigen ligase
LALRLSPALAWQAALLAGAAALGVLAGARPELAIVLPLALVFVALVVADLSIGLCAFAFIAFIDVLPGGPALSVTKVAGLLLALSWLATIATREDVKDDFFSRHPAAVYLLVLFAAWTAASALWSQDSGEALTAASRYGLNFLLFPIVFTAVRERRHVGWLAWTFVAGALFSAAYGLVSPPPTAEGRLTGAIGEANELASALVAALAIAGGLALAARNSPVVRNVAVAAAVLCLIGVLFSLSRAGMLALVMVALAMVLVADRRRGRAAVVALAVIAIVGAWAVSIAPPGERERITRVEGGAGRIDLWTVAWRMVEDRPLTGVGAGNFPVSSPRYLLEPGAIMRDEFIVTTPKQAHNIYLQALSELGLPGLVLFLSIILFALGCSVRAARAFGNAGDGRLEALAWGFTLGAFGVLVADFFHPEQFSKQLWLLLAAGPALLALSRRTCEPSVLA